MNQIRVRDVIANDESTFEVHKLEERVMLFLSFEAAIFGH